MTRISVIIAHSQYIFQSGLERIIEQNSHLELLNTVSKPELLEDLLSENKADVLLLEPRQSFIKLSRNYSRVKPIYIIEKELFHSIINIDHDSSVGILTTECKADEIYTAIEEVMNGTDFYCKEIRNLVLDKEQNREQPSKVPVFLTKREIEITKLIADGKKNREIADELNLSKHTIHTHRKNILKKVGVSSAMELINFVKNYNII